MGFVLFGIGDDVQGVLCECQEDSWKSGGYIHFCFLLVCFTCHYLRKIDELFDDWFWEESMLSNSIKTHKAQMDPNAPYVEIPH